MHRLMKLIVPAIMILPMALLAEQGAIVGYYQSWRGVPADDQLDKLTHVILFQIYPNEDGSDVVTQWWSVDDLPGFVATAHAKNVKVIVGLGGSGGATGNFMNATNDANRAQFVQVLKKFVDDNDLDGIDLDWESSVDWGQYLDLLLEMKAAMPDKRISATLGADSPNSQYGNHFTQDETLLGEYKTKIWEIDAVQLMTYDMGGDIGGINWPTSADADASQEVIDNWAAFGQGQQGFSKEKIFVGIHMNQDDNASASQKARTAREGGFGGVILWEINNNILAPAYQATVDAGGHIEGNVALQKSTGNTGPGTAARAVKCGESVKVLLTGEIKAADDVQVSLYDLRGRMVLSREVSFSREVGGFTLPQNTLRNQNVILHVKGKNGFEIRQMLRIP